MPYVAHLCSSSKLGCRGAERPSAAQRRGAPERRAVARGAPERLSGMSPAAVRHGPCRRPARALPPSLRTLGGSPIVITVNPLCVSSTLSVKTQLTTNAAVGTRLEPWYQHADF